MFTWTARRSARISVAAVAVVGMVVVELFHASGQPLYKTLWAEDGPVFFQGALGHVPIFETHAGYAQFAPRVVSWGSAHLALDDAAIWFAVVPAVVTAVLAVAVFRLSDFLVTSPVLRAVLAASFVLPPVLAGESFGNAANLQWPLLAACFWALARPSESWRDVTLCSVIAVVTALSSSVAFVYVPLALVVIVVRRERRLRVVPTLFVAACVAQGALALSASSSAVQHGSDALDLPQLYVVRVIGSTILGERPLISAWVHLGVGIAVVLGVAGGVLVAALFSKSDRDGRIWGGAAIAASIAVFGSTTYYRGTELFRLFDSRWNPSGARYVGCSLQLLVAGLVVLVARPRVAARWHAVLVWVVAAQAIVAPAITWRPETTRSHGVQWRVELAGARRYCAGTKRATFALVPITPEPAAWKAAIQCSRLR